MAEDVADVTVGMTPAEVFAYGPWLVSTEPSGLVVDNAQAEGFSVREVLVVLRLVPAHREPRAVRVDLTFFVLAEQPVTESARACSYFFM